VKGNGLSRLRPGAPRVILLLVLAAGVVRLVGLGRVPPGLHYDEAFNGLDALGILQGRRPVFFEGNFGREPLYMYVLAGLYSLFEPTPALNRSIAAVAGTLAVPFTYGIALELFPQRRRLAPAAALLQAFLPWDLHFSRYGLRVELLPLLGSAAVYFLLRAWRRRAWVESAAAGLFLGLSLYGYMAARLLPLVFLAWAALALPRAPRRERLRLCAGIAVALGIAGVVFAPLGSYFLAHPASFSYRAGQVVLKGGVGEVARQLGANAWLWLKAFVISGDTNPRNNLPGAPSLTAWMALPWIAGCLCALRRLRRPDYAFPLVWLVLMLTPSLASDYAPSFQRAVGAIPPLAILVALGLTLLADRVDQRLRRPRLGLALLALLLAGQSAVGLYQYFVVWGRGNAVYYAFDEGIYRIGLYMRERALAGEWVYLSPVRPDHATLHLIMRDVGGPVTFDGRRVFVVASRDGRPVEYVFLTGEDNLGPRKAHFWYPEAQKVASFNDFGGEEYAVAFRAESLQATPADPQVETHVRWRNGIFLDGLDMVQAKPNSRDGLVQAYWSTDTPVDLDYTWFVHLIGPPNEASGSILWAGADDMPGGGTYPTSAWRPGETIVESRSLAGPDNLITGDYYLELGWYLLETGERLRLTGPSWAGDRKLIGPFHLDVTGGVVTVGGD